MIEETEELQLTVSKAFWNTQNHLTNESCGNN